MNCPMCRSLLTVSRPPFAEGHPTLYQCTSCTAKVLCHSDTPPGLTPASPPPAEPDAPARNLMWVVERLPFGTEIERRMWAAIVAYCVCSIEALASGRTRTDMVNAIEGHRVWLMARLQAMLDAEVKP